MWMRKTKFQELAFYEVVLIDALFFNERGMYSLILRSKLDAAKKFKQWVTEDVLLSIRKQGFYNSLGAVFKNRKLI